MADGDARLEALRAQADDALRAVATDDRGDAVHDELVPDADVPLATFSETCKRHTSDGSNPVPESN